MWKAGALISLYHNYTAYAHLVYGRVIEPRSWADRLIPFAPLTARTIRTDTEALRTMPSAHSSSTVEQLALPLLPSLYSHAFWLTRDRAEAEDLAQETISKALRAFDSFQDGTNFKAWVFRILRNTFLTSRTGVAASRTVFLEDHPDMLDTVDASPTPEDTLIQLNNEVLCMVRSTSFGHAVCAKFFCCAMSRNSSTKTSHSFSTCLSAQ